jgi:hypothetical protein
MLFGAFTAVQGQLVQPKTVPVHQDEQFAIFPSARAGMGGVSISLDDTLSDVFNNPSRATGVRKGIAFAAPFNHNTTSGHGGGRTLPMGAVGSSGDWSGSFIVAFQGLDHSASSNRLHVGDASNQYVQGGIARRFPNDLSIGASAYRAKLHALDASDLLFDGSDAIRQTGTITDVRVGATKLWGDRRLEVSLVNDRTSLTNIVDYSTSAYTDLGQEDYYWTEADRDQTNIWGLHTAFAQPMGDGWRFGWIATANRLTHPQIPNYEIRNVPIVRFDPGTTYAFDFGVGFSHQSEGNTVGIDFVQEPMSSRTWGNAQDDILLPNGHVIAEGAHTVDNRFRFANSKFRAGWQHDLLTSRDSVSLLGFQFGLSVYSVNYELQQDDHIAQSHRVANEGWHEVTPTLGFHVAAKYMTVRYNYRLTCSTNGGTCDFGLGLFGSGDKVTVPQASIIAAPTQAVRVNGGTARYHQLVISVPLK